MNIYKGEKTDANLEDQVPDLSNGIKLRPEDNLSQTPGGRPLIQELSTASSEETPKPAKQLI